MTTIADLKVGDLVKHANLGKGRVTKIEDGVVSILYEGEERRTIGKYDDVFFRTHPNSIWKSP